MSSTVAASPPRSAHTYERDTFAWAMEQARLIRAGRLDLIDAENVAEEIESVGTSVRSELKKRVRTIVEHLLKLESSPALEPRRGWRETVLRSRRDLTDVLEDSPSLRPELRRLLSPLQDETARFTAQLLEGVGESNVRIERRMASGGYTLDQILGPWFPDAPVR